MTNEQKISQLNQCIRYVEHKLRSAEGREEMVLRSMRTTYKLKIKKLKKK